MLTKLLLCIYTSCHNYTPFLSINDLTQLYCHPPCLILTLKEEEKKRRKKNRHKGIQWKLDISRSLGPGNFVCYISIVQKQYKTKQLISLSGILFYQISLSHYRVSTVSVILLYQKSKNDTKQNLFHWDRTKLFVISGILLYQVFGYIRIIHIELPLYILFFISGSKYG